MQQCRGISEYQGNTLISLATGKGIGTVRAPGRLSSLVAEFRQHRLEVYEGRSVRLDSWERVAESPPVAGDDPSHFLCTPYSESRSSGPLRTESQ